MNISLQIMSYWQFSSYYTILSIGGGNGMGSNNSRKKKEQCATKFTQSLPILASTFAAILTEGKNVKEMENMALFFDALANSIYYIAAATDKNGILPDEFPQI